MSVFAGGCSLDNPFAKEYHEDTSEVRNSFNRTYSLSRFAKHNHHELIIYFFSVFKIILNNDLRLVKSSGLVEIERK